MHSEKIIIPLQLVRDLIKKGGKAVLAVGTTSVRTLESIYWLGVKILIDGAGEHLRVHQWDPYEKKYSANIEIQEALQAVADYLEKRGMDEYSGSTELLIVPGYRFRIPDGLITNFHMPQSTLLLLVAAFTGPGWKTAYEYALKHDFRFLSYGDACLFFPYKGD
jgi:S-adenosylmethionine:tRNA ribosyltransferase-isomerase